MTLTSASHNKQLLPKHYEERHWRKPKTATCCKFHALFRKCFTLFIKGATATITQFPRKFPEIAWSCVTNEHILSKNIFSTSLGAFVSLRTKAETNSREPKTTGKQIKLKIYLATFKLCIIWINLIPLFWFLWRAWDLRRINVFLFTQRSISKLALGWMELRGRLPSDIQIIPQVFHQNRFAEERRREYIKSIPG